MRLDCDGFPPAFLPKGPTLLPTLPSRLPDMPAELRPAARIRKPAFTASEVPSKTTLETEAKEATETSYIYKGMY
jgi:hypothetical protein